jgi:hypothetical protein
MRRRSRYLAAAGTVCLAAASLGIFAAGAVPASASQHPRHEPNARSEGRSEGRLIIADVAPSTSPTNASIFGVKPGGKPWRIDHGIVVLTGAGRLIIEVSGLVVTTTGTNPVPDVAASVYCNGALVQTTAPSPFSSSGNAHIRAQITLPSFCPAPAVLLNPATGAASTDVLPAYIAYDGTAST